MVKRILWLALSGTGILALLGVVLFAWLWVQIDRFGQIHRAQRADVIVVLGARVWPSGRPSDALARRTLHAVKLYQEGLAAAIICSGGLGTHPPTEAQDDDHIRSLGALYLAEAVNLCPQPGEQDHAQQGQDPRSTWS